MPKTDSKYTMVVKSKETGEVVYEGDNFIMAADSIDEESFFMCNSADNLITAAGLMQCLQLRVRSEIVDSLFPHQAKRGMAIPISLVEEMFNTKPENSN